MTLKSLLASVIAVALIAGLPAVALAGVAGPDCAATSSANTDGCGGGADQSGCWVVCPVSPAAVAASVVGELQPMPQDAPLKRDSWLARLFTRQPETAPPKSPSA